MSWLDQMNQDFRTQVVLENARGIAQALMEHQAQLADQQARSTRFAMWAAIAAATGTLIQAGVALWPLIKG